MQKQKKQMLAVTIIFVLFVAAYLGMKTYNNKQAEQETAKEDAQKVYITDFDTEDITAFSYQVEDTTLSFEKEEDWKCTNDENIQLDQSAITTMLDAVAQLEAENVVKTEEDLSIYGFDSPMNILTFTTKDGTTTLKIGMENNIVGQYYVTKNEENTLYLVNESVLSAFKKTLVDLEEVETETEAETEE